MQRFQGKTALVTGAGGSIGSAVATQLSAEGAELVLMDRDPVRLDDAAKSCGSAGTEARTFVVDQTDPDAVVEAIGKAWIGSGRIDVLFANAGYGSLSPYLELSHTSWRRHVDVNLSGTHYVCQAIAARMRTDRGGGSIILNSSIGAVVYTDHLPAYCATKAALRMLTVAMASELGMHRIRVNAVLPGVIESEMTRELLDDPRHREAVLAETPVGRLGQPDDVARLVCFLASEEAAYITGAAIPIDGGQSIHGNPRWFRADYRRSFEEHWEIGR